MPTARQGMTSSTATIRGLGPLNGHSTSDTITLKKIYHSSPLTPDLDQKIKEDFIKYLTEPVTKNEAFGIFNMDYSGLGGKLVPPDYGNVDTGGAGLPASAWVPNPASPGEGNGVNASSQPAAADGYGKIASDTPGDGEGSALSPKASSAILGQIKLGSYLLGSRSKL